MTNQYTVCEQIMTSEILLPLQTTGHTSYRSEPFEIQSQPNQGAALRVRILVSPPRLPPSLLNRSHPTNPHSGMAVAIQNAAAYECTSNSLPNNGMTTATAALQEPAPTPAIRPA